MEDAITITTAMANRNNSITATIKKYGKQLMGFIKQRVAIHEDAEDILQDVLYQFAGNVDTIEQAGSWLYQAARNRITDNYRKHRLPLTDDLFAGAGGEETDWKELILSDTADPESSMLRNLFWEQLQAALDELPAEQKDIFIMNEINGIGFKELAGITGIAVPTLISRKRYAVLHLRKRLAVLKDELMGF